jgi:hypothetical protein
VVSQRDWGEVSAHSICHWTEDINGVWDTDCGKAFVLDEGGPEDNGMIYCCYCSKTLVEVTYKEEDEETQ